MTKCAIINIETNEIISFIIAEPNDPIADGYKLMLIPEGYYWDGLQLRLINDE